ncbi:MAG: hypothetical protein QXU98_12280, partial [Candidatus Parvarchaeota archaeon]
NGYYFSIDNDGTGSSEIVKLVSSSPTTLASTTQTLTLNQFYILSAEWGGSTVAQTLNYSGAISATDTTYSSLSYLSLSAYLGATWKINWLRTRAYPPNGVMPSVSFGAVQPPITTTLSISTNPITYGQNDTITASVSPNTDTISIFINGVNVSSATNTTTIYLNTPSIWYAANLSVGSNNITAVANGVNQTTLLNITQATPNLTISVPPNFTYNNTNLSIFASSQANSSGNLTGLLFLNQLNQNLYLNGVLVNSTTANIENVSWIENLSYIQSGANLSAGTYSYEYSVIGNNNYTSANIYGNFTIEQATPTLTLSANPSANYTYNGTGINATYSITSINNQLTGILYLNGASVASTTTSGSYLSGASAGTYDFVFNTTGNTNYTSASATPINMAITQATPTLTLTINPSTNFVGNVSNATISYSITTINNQLSANLIINSSYTNDSNFTVATTNSNGTFNINQSDTYQIYFTTQGNTNYTSAQATPILNYTIYPYEKFSISNFTYNGSNSFITIYFNGTLDNDTYSLYEYNLSGSPQTNTYYAGNYGISPTADGTLSGTLYGVNEENSPISISTPIPAGVYNYTLSASSPDGIEPIYNVSAQLNISKATPTLSLSCPANFSYGADGTVNFSISTINNQLNATLWLNGVNTSTTNNSSSFTLTEPPYPAGTYNAVLNTTGNSNYTANSVNCNFTIIPQQGNITLLLNGTNGNATIQDWQTIPITITSTDTGSPTNTSLYVNGTEVFSGIANSTYNYTANLTCNTLNNTVSLCNTLNITAITSNINYTNATQTWYLSVMSLPSNITLVQPYIYLGLDNQPENTSNQIYALLNYSFNVSYSTVFNLTNITVSFGNGNIDTILNENATSGYAQPFYNEYTNNSNINYTIWINATDINNDTFSVPINITTQVSIPPTVTAPLVAIVINGIQNIQNYTWTAPYSTTLIFNASAGNFPIVNTTVNFGDNSTPLVIPPFNGTQQESISHTFLTNGTFNVTVFTTAISGLNSTVNYSLITVYPYVYPKVTLETTQAYTHNQSYLFNFTQGTFTGSYVVIVWGDGTSTSYNFIDNGVSQQFILYHNYSVPTTYNLQATVYDTQGLKNSGVLTNPQLTVNSFTFPSIMSVMPNEPWNGANYLANTYNITFTMGSYPLANMTINWADS